MWVSGEDEPDRNPAARPSVEGSCLRSSPPPRLLEAEQDRWMLWGPGAVCPLLIGALGSSAIRARWTRTDGSPISSSPPSPSARNAAPRASSSIAGCSRRKARMLFISRASRSGPSQCPPRAGGGPGRPSRRRHGKASGVPAMGRRRQSGRRGQRPAFRQQSRRLNPSSGGSARRGALARARGRGRRYASRKRGSPLRARWNRPGAAGA